MSDLISRQTAINEISRWLGYLDDDMILRIQMGLRKLPSVQHVATDINVGDTISRQAAIDKFEPWLKVKGYSEGERNMLKAVLYELTVMPSAQPEYIQNNAVHLCDSCQYTYATCPSHGNDAVFGDGKGNDNICACNKYRPISAQPEKEIPKRVMWNGWKGMRDTRYKCPNCKKPVRNTDIYCHRCGQKLMFPNIDFTPYVEGQKQELVVRWDDEEICGKKLRG